MNYTKFLGYNIDQVYFGRYRETNNVSIELFSITEGPIACATVNIDKLPEGFISLDTNNCGEEIVDWLLENNIITGKPIMYLQSGYCTYPVYKLVK